jgi:hypothetical protein
MRRPYRDPIGPVKDLSPRGPPAPTCVRSSCGVTLGDRYYLPQVGRDDYGPVCGVCCDELLGLLPPARERLRQQRAA